VFSSSVCSSTTSCSSGLRETSHSAASFGSTFRRHPYKVNDILLLLTPEQLNMLLTGFAEQSSLSPDNGHVPRYLIASNFNLSSTPSSRSHTIKRHFLSPSNNQEQTPSDCHSLTYPAPHRKYTQCIIRVPIKASRNTTRNPTNAACAIALVFAGYIQP